MVGRIRADFSFKFYPFLWFYNLFGMCIAQITLTSRKKVILEASFLPECFPLAVSLVLFRRTT